MPLGFPSGVFINEAKTSDKNTGPRFSIINCSINYYKVMASLTLYLQYHFNAQKQSLHQAMMSPISVCAEG